MPTGSIRSMEHLLQKYLGLAASKEVAKLTVAIQKRKAYEERIEDARNEGARSGRMLKTGGTNSP